MDPAIAETFQVAMQENIWDSSSHSSAGLFLSKHQHQLKTLSSL